MKYFINIWICLLMAVALFAQDVPPENQIVFLHGGNTDVKLSYYSQLISGYGLGMGFHTTDVWDVWTNPASMVSFKSTFFGVNIMPPLAVDAASFTDINQTIEDELDDAIVDYRTDETQLEYPTLAARGGQNGGLYGVQFVAPVTLRKHNSIFSFEIGQPFYLNMNMDNDGFDTLIETRKEVGDQNKVIKLRMNSVFQSRLEVKALKYQFGLAGMINPNLAFGLKIGQTRIHTLSSNEAKMDGIMETAGTMYAFNDPYDPHIDFANGETNKLGQSAYIDFNGSGMNTQVGLLFNGKSKFTLGMDFDWQSDVELSGTMNVEQYTIPALNVDALINNDNTDDNEEELVDATKLDLAKLTLTEPVQNKTSDHMVLNMPSSLGMQASYQGRSVQFTLGFRKYFNQFGYDFLDEKYFALMNYGLDMNLTAGIFELSLSGINADLIQEKEGVQNSAENYWIPAFSMKFAFFVAKQYQVSSQLFMAPTPGIGIKLGYFFH